VFYVHITYGWKLKAVSVMKYLTEFGKYLLRTSRDKS